MCTHYGAARTGRRPPCAQLPVRDGAALDPPGEASAPSPGPPPRAEHAGRHRRKHGAPTATISLRERPRDRNLPKRVTSPSVLSLRPSHRTASGPWLIAGSASQPRRLHGSTAAERTLPHADSTPECGQGAPAPQCRARVRVTRAAQRSSSPKAAWRRSQHGRRSSHAR